jgi:hypothetical protein
MLTKISFRMARLHSAAHTGTLLFIIGHHYTLGLLL